MAKVGHFFIHYMFHNLENGLAVGQKGTITYPSSGTMIIRKIKDLFCISKQKNWPTIKNKKNRYMEKLKAVVSWWQNLEKILKWYVYLQ